MQSDLHHFQSLLRVVTSASEHVVTEIADRSLCQMPSERYVTDRTHVTVWR